MEDEGLKGLKDHLLELDRIVKYGIRTQKGVHDTLEKLGTSIR